MNPFKRIAQPTDRSHQEFTETVELLASDVAELQAQIQQMNGHSIELEESRRSDRTKRERKPWR